MEIDEDDAKGGGAAATDGAPFLRRVASLPEKIDQTKYPFNIRTSRMGSSSHEVTRTRIIQIGHSKGIRVPKMLLEHAQLPDEVELQAEHGRLIVRAGQASGSVVGSDDDRSAGHTSGDVPG